MHSSFGLLSYVQQEIKAAHTAFFPWQPSFAINARVILSFASQNQVYYLVVAKPLSLPKFFVMKSQQGITTYPLLAFQSGRQNAKKRYILYYDEKPRRDNGCEGKRAKKG